MSKKNKSFNYSNTYEEHNFYCLNCGRKGISIARNRGFKREKLHRKRMYCPWCKIDINHIECNTLDEIEIFKSNFLKGLYAQEALDSMSYCAVI